MRLPHPGGLWHNPDFVKLWTGQTVSVFGSLISRAALPFLAVPAQGATPRHIALLNAAGTMRFTNGEKGAQSYDECNG